LEKVNLAQKFSLFQDYWSPKIAGELNDSYLKLAKLKGEFVWHQHEAEGPGRHRDQSAGTRSGSQALGACSVIRGGR